MMTNDSQNPSPRTDAARTRRSRRRWWWSGSIATAVVVLCLIVFIAPRHAARYVVAQELDRMGVVHEGIGTIDIDVWEQEASFGPVRFRMAADGPGQIARFRLKLRLWNLLSQRALVESVIVEGVDIRVKRAADGTFTLNGVSLAAAGPEAAPPDASEDQEGSDWGAALENLELRDSRLVFIKAGGGEAVIEIDRLTLAGFRTWTPDDPGTFDLTGRVNNIAFKIKGDAKPFAERISATVDATLANTEVEKVERFTGPLGFQRRAGVLGGKIVAEAALYPDGRIDATAKGQIEITGVDMAREDVAAATARSIRVDFDNKVVVAKDGRQTASGRATAKIDGVRLEFGGNRSIDAATVNASFTDLTATRGADGQIDIELKPATTVTDLRMTGPERISLSMVEFPPGKVTLSGQPGNLELTTVGIMKAGKLMARFRAAEGVSLAAAATTVDVDAKLGIGADTRTVSGRVDTRIDGLAAEAGSDAAAAAENVVLSVSDLAATFGPLSAIEVGARSSVTVAGLKLTAPQTLTLESVEGSVSTLKLSGTAEDLALNAAGKIAARNVNAKIRTDRLLEATIGHTEVQIGEFAGNLASGRAPEWKTKLTLTTEAVNTSLDGGKAASADVASIAVRDVAVNHESRVEIAEFIVTRLKANLTEAIAGQNGGKKAAKVVSAVKAPPVEKADGKQAETPKAGIPAIKIGRIALADGAHIAFKDGSVAPPVDAKIAVETLEVKNIDSTAASARSDVRIKAKVNEFTGIDVTGWVAPFGGKPDMDLAMKITGLELPRFSAYAAKAAGVHVESGQLNVDAVAKAVKADLDATVKVNLKDLKFEPLSAEEAKKLSAAVGMPVETAVGLLQDSDNAINLTIPIRGTISKPEYDLSDAIGQAVGGALKSLFPPTALASMLISAGKSGIAFQPIPFAGGSDALGPKAMSFADKLAELLTERPKLSIRVCGRATAEDLASFAARKAAELKTVRQPGSTTRPKSSGQADGAPPPLSGKALISAAETELSKLALARTNAIRGHLLKKAEGLGRRLSECRSKFDPDDQGPPRVDVSL